MSSFIGKIFIVIIFLVILATLAISLPALIVAFLSNFFINKYLKLRSANLLSEFKSSYQNVIFRLHHNEPPKVLIDDEDAFYYGPATIPVITFFAIFIFIFVASKFPSFSEQYIQNHLIFFSLNFLIILLTSFAYYLLILKSINSRYKLLLDRTRVEILFQKRFDKLKSSAIYDKVIQFFTANFIWQNTLYKNEADYDLNSVKNDKIYYTKLERFRKYLAKNDFVFSIPELVAIDHDLSNSISSKEFMQKMGKAKSHTLEGFMTRFLRFYDLDYKEDLLNFSNFLSTKNIFLSPTDIHKKLKSFIEAKKQKKFKDKYLL